MKKGAFVLFAVLVRSLTADPIAIQGFTFTQELQELVEMGSELVWVDPSLLGYKQELEEIGQTYVGLPIDEERLLDAKETFANYFAEKLSPFTLLELPEQEVSSGRIAFVLTSAKIERVTVEGNRWFSSCSIQNALDLRKGDSINQDELLNRVAWLNRNPFIYSDAIFSPGAPAGTTQVEVISSDRFPLRVFGGVDNTGNSFTGNERFFAGFTVSAGLRNLFTYHFTSSFDFPEFQAHYANWTCFLPWMHELVIYGGYGIVHPTINQFPSTGRDIQGSLRYTVPIKPLYKEFRQEASAGVDFKQTNSDVFFLSSDAVTRVPVNQHNAALFQFYGGYLLQQSWPDNDVTFKAELFFSPFQWLSNQNSAHYDSLRRGAKPRYVYGRAFVADVYELAHKMKIAGSLRVQASYRELLPSEQFGLGGASTVRGYQEREFNADNAICTSFEFRAPPLSLTRKRKNELIFLAFVDYGWGHNWSSSFPQQSTDWLMGIGPGLRYSMFPYLEARLDYGFKLHETQFGNSNLGRANFSVTVAY